MIKFAIENGKTGYAIIKLTVIDEAYGEYTLLRSEELKTFYILKTYLFDTELEAVKAYWVRLLGYRDSAQMELLSVENDIDAFRASFVDQFSDVVSLNTAIPADIIERKD